MTTLDNLRAVAGCGGLRFMLGEPVYELGAGFHSELPENARQMVLDGVLAHAGKARDLTVALARIHPLRDFLLARAQAGKSGGEPLLHGIEQAQHAAEDLVKGRRKPLQRPDVSVAKRTGNPVKADVACEAALAVVNAMGGDVDQPAFAKDFQPRRRNVRPGAIDLEQLRLLRGEPAAQDRRVDGPRPVAQLLQIAQGEIHRHHVIERNSAGVQVPVARREHLVREHRSYPVAHPALVLVDGRDPGRLQDEGIERELLRRGLIPARTHRVAA